MSPKPAAVSEQQKIGSFIQEVREERGLTQSEFARLLRTSQSAVARMEAGEQNFSTETLAKVSQVLKREIIQLADRSVSFRIEGGRRLHGAISVNSSKNAAVSLLCASLLNRGTTVLRGMPRIEEVFRLLEVLTSIGVRASWDGSTLTLVPPKQLKLSAMDTEAAVKTRSVLMLIGSLVHRTPRFSVPLSGGCKLGARTVQPHEYALAPLGVTIDTVHDRYEVSAKKLQPADVTLYEMGDTVTENALLAAAGIPGTTTFRLASANYMVQDLCHFLRALGVELDGIGTSTLTVRGVSGIDRRVEYHVGEDPVEAMMFIAMAATTGSRLTVRRCPTDFLRIELLRLEKMGLKMKILKRYTSENGWMELADVEVLPSELHALPGKLEPLPGGYGINIDNLPFFVPVATQAHGKTLVHDWVYENRAIYFLELQKLRANVTLVDPHRVYVEGPTKLKGAEVICPPALRPAAIILIAMLAAEGTSTLRNVYSIARGYEDLAARLKTIGAQIETIHGM